MNKNDKLFGHNEGEFSWPFNYKDATSFVKNATFWENKEDFFKYFLNDYIFNETKNYVDNKCPYSLVNEGVSEYDSQIDDFFNSDLEAQEMNSEFLKKIESWNYINIISSALFYCLKQKVSTKHLSVTFWANICSLVVHRTLGEEIFLLLQRNAFVKYNPDLAILGIYYFLFSREPSFACRTESSGLNQIGVKRLLTLLEINQVKIEQLIETSVEENSLNAIISFLDNYSFPQDDFSSLDKFKNKTKSNSKLTLRKDILLKGKKLDEIISELEALGFATFPQKQDVGAYLENLSQEEFEQLCNEVLEKYDLIGERNLENLKKSEFKLFELIGALVLALIFISKLAGFSYFRFPNSRSPFAALSTVVLTPRRNNFSSNRVSTPRPPKPSINKQTTASTLSKKTILYIGKERIPVNLCIHFNCDGPVPTVAIYGTLFEYRNKSKFNQALQKYVAQEFPGCELLPYDLDHALPAAMGKAMDLRASLPKNDTSTVCAIHPRLNKLRANEKFFLDERAKYDCIGSPKKDFKGLAKISLERSGAEMLVHIETEESAAILLPFKEQIKQASEDQKIQCLNQASEYMRKQEIRRDGQIQDCSVIFMERKIKQTHLGAEHEALRVESFGIPFADVIDELADSVIRSQAINRSLLDVFPNKDSHGARTILYMNKQEMAEVMRTLDIFSVDLQNKRTSKDLKKVDEAKKRLEETPTKKFSLEEINQTHIDDELYSSQGKQGRRFSDLSKKPDLLKKKDKPK